MRLHLVQQRLGEVDEDPCRLEELRLVLPVLGDVAAQQAFFLLRALEDAGQLEHTLQALGCQEVDLAVQV